MPTAIGLSAVGMSNDLKQLDIISHNLANAKTPGYKRDISVTAGFDQLMSGAMSAVDMPQSARNLLVPGVERVIDFSPGALHFTGNPLDVAIEGDAYFELQGAEGTRFGRHGAFSVDASGRLTDANGLVVSTEEGELLLHGGDVTIDSDGKVSENGDYAGQLKLVRFSSSEGLSKAGGGTMKAAVGTNAEPAVDVEVRQGYQETSNVRSLDEMSRMMTTLRHFETTARVIKGYDEMIGTAISTIAEF